MNASKVALLLVSVLFLSVQAEASCSNIPTDMLFVSAGGDKGGNAGNGMEILFRAKADEVLGWVKRNRLREIDTHGLDKNEITDRLLTQKWRVCMSDEPVYVEGTADRLDPPGQHRAGRTAPHPPERHRALRHRHALHG